MRSSDGMPERMREMAGARVALVVANDEYNDPGLRSLVAPAHDAAALAAALADPSVGGFDVRVLHNESAQEIRVAVEDFFADRAPEDLLLLHFSCHGLKNAAGELFLAVADTRPARLASTAVAADFVNRQMADSRAQRIALFLDCCYGGAFPRGMVVRAAGEAQVRDAFAGQADVGGGRGRVVVTASSAMEYAFEGGRLASGVAPEPSVFTGAVVDGLTTGEADRDGDGWIGLTELVGYVTDRVRRTTPHQNPQMWTFGAQGELLIARSRIRRITPAVLAPELVEALESPLPAARFGVVDYLRERLTGPDLSQAYAAWQALQPLVDDDSRRVAMAATEALAEVAPRVTPEVLELGPDGGELRLEGPPLVQTAVATSDADWLKVEQDEGVIHVTVVDAAATGEATLTVSGPTGERSVPVRLTLPDTESEPPAPSPEPEPEPSPEPAPVPEPPRAAIPTHQVPWWIIAVLIVGSALLIYLNWPGEAETRKIWYDEDTTGWYVYRSSGDPIILSSFVALLASLAARSGWPLVLGVLAGCLASILEDGVLILVGGIASDESTKLFGAWTTETVAWLLTGAVALVMAVVLLYHYRPEPAPLWPVPLGPTILAVVGAVLMMVSALWRDSSGVSFFQVTRLAALEPFVILALAWLAVTAKWGTDAAIWLGATTTTYALVSIVAAIPALTQADVPPVFITALIGNALVTAAVVSRGWRLPSRP
jgi:uncharacterized caspase-like protein